MNINFKTLIDDILQEGKGRGNRSKQKRYGNLKYTPTLATEPVAEQNPGIDYSQNKYILSFIENLKDPNGDEIVNHVKNVCSGVITAPEKTDALKNAVGNITGAIKNIANQIEI